MPSSPVSLADLSPAQARLVRALVEAGQATNSKAHAVIEGKASHGQRPARVSSMDRDTELGESRRGRLPR